MVILVTQKDLLQAGELELKKVRATYIHTYIHSTVPAQLVFVKGPYPAFIMP